MSDAAVAAARSLLYAPGTRPDRVAKAAASGADAVIVDLEDAVPAAAKDEARAGARSALTGAAAGAPLLVRIDLTAPELDLAAVALPALAGIVVPKAEPAVLERLDGLAAAAGIPAEVPFVALLETATGVLHAEEVARHPRVVRLAVGEADLAGELRLGGDVADLLTGVRLAVVLASAAAGVAAPIGPVERHLDDPDLLLATSRTLVRQGFRGRTVLHPRQLDVVNAAFTPSGAEIADARAVVADFEATGSGTLVGRDGRFVDRAVVRAAREVLARAPGEVSGVRPDREPHR